MIGTRLLKVNLAGVETDLKISVAIPQGSGTDWTCRFEIAWPGAPRNRVARGVDALQAAYLAQQMIGAELYASDYHRRGQLQWNKPGEGYGFPVPKTIRDLLVGEDKVFEG